MDIRKVKKLIELLEESGIAELEISEGEESVRISRHPRMTVGAPAAIMAPPSQTAAASMGAPASPARLLRLSPTGWSASIFRRR